MNETETKLSVIWKKLLEKENIEINDDFYQLGGNSIKALLLVSEIHQVFNANLLITDIAECRTIEKLAALLERLPIEEN